MPIAGDVVLSLLSTPFVILRMHCSGQYNNKGIYHHDLCVIRVKASTCGDCFVDAGPATGLPKHMIENQIVYEGP